MTVSPHEIEACSIRRHFFRQFFSVRTIARTCRHRLKPSGRTTPPLASAPDMKFPSFPSSSSSRKTDGKLKSASSQ
eukprot:g2871.t1